MYKETKIAVRKAFDIGKLLFSISKSDYNRLLFHISKIKKPSKETIELYKKKGISVEDAIIIELRKRYINAAKEAGFEEKYGIAMLNYTALLQDIKE